MATNSLLKSWMDDTALTMITTLRTLFEWPHNTRLTATTSARPSSVGAQRDGKFIRLLRRFEDDSGDRLVTYMETILHDTCEEGTNHHERGTRRFTGGT